MQFITMQKSKTTLRARAIRIGYKESVATFVVERKVHNNREEPSRKTSVGYLGEASELLPILLQAWGISTKMSLSSFWCKFRIVDLMTTEVL
jgi:hypothetical protein